MNPREMAEKTEFENLSAFASKASESNGRERQEESSNYSTCFQRDCDRITHSKAFRRLMHKTQVFIAPEGDHYLTRLTHTLEVSQISRAIARALKLNEDLVEAIALGHDLGHTPFGHMGEAVLNTLTLDIGGFRHNEQSRRVVTVLERDGSGLNLTYETLDGIVNHRLSTTPATLEGQVVRYADKIAYLNHDIDDAIRAEILSKDDLPQEAKTMGSSTEERIDYLINSVVVQSEGRGEIQMESGAWDCLIGLRRFMFRNVYAGQIQAKERMKIKGMITALWNLYVKEPRLLPATFQTTDSDINIIKRSACDYIAGMTDRFALRIYFEHFVPESWRHDQC